MTPKVGAYEVLHQLSTGGMGAVLLGRRRGPGAFEQLVAIKTIKPEYASASAVRAMFLDEAAILARVAHPGIATVHDFGEQDGELYMVMEYVAGNSFRSLLEAPLPPIVAARAIAEACRGLHAAHEVRDTSGALLGVVHRDISPDNLMLGFDGHVKVIDFGIALVKNRQAPVTEFGTVKGKPPYMSPEQVKNEAIDRRSDVFSLGVVLHELLTGQPLFDGDSIYAIARAVEHQQIAPPSAVVGAALPAGLDAAVMHALDRDATRRPQTAAQLAEELERVVAAAGGESLEAWAERELSVAREAHRAWIAGIVAGHDTPKPRVGRATGAVTAVGPAALAALGVQPLGGAAPAEGPSPAPRGSPDAALAKTILPPASDPGLDLPARRSRIIPLVVLVALVAAIVVVVVLIRGSSHTASPRDGGSSDTGPAIDALVIEARDASTPVDLPPDAPPIDAPIDIDAARVDASAPVDAGRRPAPPDARTALPPIDAAPPPDARVATAIDAAPQASGTGTVSFNNPPKGSSVKFVTVVLDGKNLGTTPILGRTIPAGHHEVQYVGVDRTETTSFDLAPGEHKKLTPPLQ